MIARALAMYLAQEIPSLVYSETDPTGVNVFIGHLPEAPDEAIVLRQSSGLPSSAKIGYDGPTIQVVVRGTTNPLVGDALGREVYGKIHGLTSTTLPDSTRLILARGLQSGPTDIGPDENGRYRYGMNFAITVRSQTDHRE